MPMRSRIRRGCIFDIMISLLMPNNNHTPVTCLGRRVYQFDHLNVFETSRGPFIATFRETLPDSAPLVWNWFRLH